MQLKIWQKGLLIVSVPLVLQAVFVFSLIQLQRQTDALAEQERRDYDINEAVEEIGRSFMATCGILLKARHLPADELNQRISEQSAIVTHHADHLVELTANEPELEGKALRVHDSVDETMKVVRQIKDSQSVFSLAGGSISQQGLNAAIASFRDSVHAMREDMRARKARNPIEARKSRERMQTAIWSGLVASAVLTLIMALYFLRGIAGRVTMMEQNTYRFVSRQPLLPKVGGGDEIGRLDDVFHDMADSVHQADQRKQEFLAMMSHDIRTPLMALVAGLALIRKGVYGTLEDRATTRLDDMQSSVNRIISMINELLDLERLQAGSLPMNLADENVARLIDTAVTSVVQLAESKNVRIDKSCDAALTVQADGKRITQVLTNLLGNAVKYTPDGGSIEVRAGFDNGDLSLSVCDNGPGLTEQQQRAIFEPYMQVDNQQNRQIAGSGLGLAISKQLVEAHRGTLTVTSVLNSGSTFCVTIPSASLLPEKESEVLESGQIADCR